MTTQATNRGTSDPVLIASADTGRVRWLLRNSWSYERMEAAISSFNIRSARTADRYYLITSRNIRMQVYSLGPDFQGMVPGTAAALNEWLDYWRALKDAGDRLSYNQGTTELAVEAMNIRRARGKDDNGYLGTEQHCVWAMAASARTGCIFPPEFFIDNEAFGGTAGNGPQIESGGYIGEQTSTIAMAHDTDWMIGRLFAVGPLGGLNALRPYRQYQSIRMGSAGLFNAAQTSAIGALPGRGLMANAPLPSPPIITPYHTREQERALRDRWLAETRLQSETERAIDQYLDYAAHGDRYFRNGLTSSFLRQGRHGWSVKYTSGYATFGDRDWIWSGSEPATQGKNDVRDNNRRVTPFFPPRN